MSRFSLAHIPEICLQASCATYKRARASAGATMNGKRLDDRQQDCIKGAPCHQGVGTHAFDLVFFFHLRSSNVISFWTNSITNDILIFRKSIAIVFFNDVFMFPFSISRFIPFSYSLSLLFFAACGDEDRIAAVSSVGLGEIRAEVVSIDRNTLPGDRYPKSPGST